MGILARKRKRASISPSQTKLKRSRDSAALVDTPLADEALPDGAATVCPGRPRTGKMRGPLLSLLFGLEPIIP